MNQKKTGTGVDLRGAVGADALLPQGFDSLPTQRVPPLYYFEISIFGDGLLKFFKGAISANIY